MPSSAGFYGLFCGNNKEADKMKNFRMMALVVAAALALAPAASALAEGFYITPKVGWSSFKADIDYDSDIGGGSDGKTKALVPFGLAFGYDFKPAFDIPVRTEVEYTYRGEKEMVTEGGADKSFKAKVGVQSVFVNAYLDIHNSSPVTPYVGLGLGYAALSTDLEFNHNGEKFMKSETNANAAWNIGAGAAWAINDFLSLDLGYRYADFGTAEEEFDAFGRDFDIGEIKTTAHEVMLGLRFSF
jgi:opacity protein-like surface antigen